MSTNEQGTTITRRGFLKGAAVAGGAAAVSTVAGGVIAGQQTTTDAPRETEQPKGYHVTPHIRAYYEKARF